MAIFPPQVSQADIERINLLRAERQRAKAQESSVAEITAEQRAAKKVNVVRPPLAKALSDELRRFAKDESGFTFIDYAITISLVSMAAGFFIPDLWALFQDTFQSVTNDVADINTRMKMK
jgi:Flp pilus assembly pilin Flp